MDSIINFSSALLGSIIGGLIAIYAALLAVRRNEYYRLSALLKAAFRDTILQLDKITGHPISIVQNKGTDALVANVKPVIPSCKRKTFDYRWKEYRYDKQSGEPWPPSEYAKLSPVEAKKLIQSRLHNLISLLK
jgi:hypothetical protein